MGRVPSADWRPRPGEVTGHLRRSAPTKPRPRGGRHALLRPRALFRGFAWIWTRIGGPERHQLPCPGSFLQCCVCGFACVVADACSFQCCAVSCDVPRLGSLVLLCRRAFRPFPSGDRCQQNRSEQPCAGHLVDTDTHVFYRRTLHVTFRLISCFSVPGAHQGRGWMFREYVGQSEAPVSEVRP